MRTRLLASVGVLVMLVAGCSRGGVPAPSGARTLGEAAAISGRYFGTAVAAFRLGDPTYSAILQREFTSITAENEMKWESIEPAPGEFRYSGADAIIATAEQMRVPVRGHTLVWHSQLAPWVEAITDPALMREAMREHITTVVSHYRGRVATWDVVNEAFAGGGGMRASVWSSLLGSDTAWIEEAFRLAHESDPDATLCYNDYDIENWYLGKTQAVYAMVSDFVARGVPIDCVGFQSHFNAASPVPDDFQTTLESFAALGVQVQITELDIEGDGEQQAQRYETVVRSCLAVPACTGITVWGIRDSDSWRADGTPLLFDSRGEAKPAYDAVLAALDAGVAAP